MCFTFPASDARPDRRLALAVRTLRWVWRNPNALLVSQNPRRPGTGRQFPQPWPMPVESLASFSEQSDSASSSPARSARDKPPRTPGNLCIRPTESARVCPQEEPTGMLLRTCRNQCTFQHFAGFASGSARKLIPAGHRMAKKPAPEVLNEERSHHKDSQNNQAGFANVPEKIQHFHVRDQSVRAAHEVANPDGGHRGNGPYEESQQEIFQPAKRQIKPARKKEIPLEQFFARPPEILGERPNRTEPTAEGFAKQKGH